MCCFVVPIFKSLSELVGAMQGHRVKESGREKRRELRVEFKLDTLLWYTCTYKVR